MNWVKTSLTLKERWSYLKHSFEWLPLTNIPSYDHDSKEWSIRSFSPIDRLSCFWAGVETVIYGYVYRSEVSE